LLYKYGQDGHIFIKFQEQKNVQDEKNATRAKVLLFFDSSPLIHSPDALKLANAKEDRKRDSGRSMQDR
jgi:hypothetical protein